jgi:Rrf2 family protein
VRITQAAGYGITSVAYLASAPACQVVSNAAICEAAQMPNRFVLQVLRKLVNEGILVSIRGVQGGYKLAKSSNKITQLEVVEAVDGLLGRLHRFEAADMTAKSSTAIEAAFSAIEADARKRLAAVTLADLRAAKAA